MIGLLVWEESSKNLRKKKVYESSVLHVRVMKAGVLRVQHMPEAVLRRRIFTAAKRLRKLGVTRVVLPEGISSVDLPTGMQVVDTLYLRQTLAADWVRKGLETQGIRAAGARVAVVAARLTGEVVRVVTELALRHRYVLVDLPHGGEELCRQLRREYGVSLLLGADKTQLEGAEVLVMFDERADLTRQNPVVVPLFEEAAAMPQLVLPPMLEEKLPQGINRVQLLAALLQAGALRAGVDLTF